MLRRLSLTKKATYETPTSCSLAFQTAAPHGGSCIWRSSSRHSENKHFSFTMLIQCPLRILWEITSLVAMFVDYNSMVVTQCSCQGKFIIVRRKAEQLSTHLGFSCFRKLNLEMEWVELLEGSQGVTRIYRICRSVRFENCHVGHWTVW